MDKRTNDLPCDIISSLPDNVKDIILMCLPTRDAVRTSILSTKWRYLWTKLPQLIFDETLSNKLKCSSKVTFKTVLFHLLLLHKGPINKFTLSMPGLKSCPEIDSLIFFLIRNGIEDLTLEMPDSECYKLPLSLLTCQQLKHLSLESCLVESTPAFKGFGKLITLKLCEVSISNEALGRLISNSPMLEVLELINSSNNYSCYDLEIDVSNLRTFKFEGLTIKIRFIKAPLLASLSIFLWADDDGNYIDTELTCNVIGFFHCLPVLENLHLHFTLLKCLAVGGVPRRLPTALVFLKLIMLSKITLDRLDELSIILCLMRNSPNLISIDIQIHIEDPCDIDASLEILKEEDNSDVMLNELREVKLYNVNGTIVELEFIKLILAKSPTLQKMFIQPGKNVGDNGCKILTHLTKFRRASKDAEVTYAPLVQ